MTSELTHELTHEFFDGALVDVSDDALVDVSDGVWVVDHSHMYLPPAPEDEQEQRSQEYAPIPIITSPDQAPFTESERNLARSENHQPIAYNLETWISQPRDPMDYFERFGVRFQPRFDASSAQEYMDNFHRVFGEDTPFFMDAAERAILREAQENANESFDNMETLDKPIEGNNECPIVYEAIQRFDKYLQCSTCRYNFSKEPVIKHLKRTRKCPMCRSNWTNNCVYVNIPDPHRELETWQREWQKDFSQAKNKKDMLLQMLDSTLHDWLKTDISRPLVKEDLTSTTFLNVHSRRAKKQYLH